MKRDQQDVRFAEQCSKEAQELSHKVFDLLAQGKKREAFKAIMINIMGARIAHERQLRMVDELEKRIQRLEKTISQQSELSLK